MQVTALGWALTIGVILALLALDLVVGTVRPHAVGFREAAAWSAFYIAVAVVFGLVFATQVGWEYGAEYFAGYIVEKSLSVDNLFVFVIIMSTFAVPREHQQRVLTFGIIAALVLRAIFIALGATLLSLFSFMFLLFGLLLLWTAVQLYRHRDEDPDVENNVLVPKVMGDTVGLSAVTVIISLAIGSQLLGFVGALLAVPTAAIIQVLIEELYLAEKDPA